MTTYALNGLGRMGKLALKPLLDRGAQIAWINDGVGDAAEQVGGRGGFDHAHGPGHGRLGVADRQPGPLVSGIDGEVSHGRLPFRPGERGRQRISSEAGFTTEFTEDTEPEAEETAKKRRQRRQDKYDL